MSLGRSILLRLPLPISDFSRIAFSTSAYAIPLIACLPTIALSFSISTEIVTMKSVCTVLLALSGASAFAPAQTARTSTKLAATEELVGLRGGNGPESGGKIVSHVL